MTEISSSSDAHLADKYGSLRGAERVELEHRTGKSWLGRGKRTAMRTQHMLMYGLNRSPILANFQNIPVTLLRLSYSLLYGENFGEVMHTRSCSCP